MKIFFSNLQFLCGKEKGPKKMFWKENQGVRGKMYIFLDSEEESGNFLPFTMKAFVSFEVAFLQNICI
jgi:hypothetical protein